MSSVHYMTLNEIHHLLVKLESSNPEAHIAVIIEAKVAMAPTF